MPLQHHEGKSHYHESVSPANDNSNHLTETVTMQHWLRLLIVLAACLLLVAAVAVAIRLLAFIGHTLQIFSLGGLLAYALAPLVELTRQRRGGTPRPRWFGVLIVFGGLFAILMLGAVFLSAEAVHQVTMLARDHTHLDQEARSQLTSAQDWLESRNIHVNLKQYLDHPPENVKSWGEATAKSVLGAFSGAAKSVLESVIILLIAVYFLIYSTEMKEWVNRALPRRLQPYAEQWETDVNRILGGFVRGQLMLALVMGVSAGVACLLLGVHFWLLIGLFVVVASLIPVIGPIIGGIPAVISAALSPPGYFPNPLVKVILVIVVFVIINEAGSKILYPRLVGKALGLHEVLVLFVLFAGLEIAGIWGVLFAAPLTALAITTVVQLHRLWQGEPPILLAELAKKGGREAKEAGTP